MNYRVDNIVTMIARARRCLATISVVLLSGSIRRKQLHIKACPRTHARIKPAVVYRILNLSSYVPVGEQKSLIHEFSKLTIALSCSH